MTHPASARTRRTTVPSRLHLVHNPFRARGWQGTGEAGFRLVATIALIASLAGSILAVPASPVLASGTDCADGQVWDDAQQMCVDPTPEGADQGQDQDQSQDQDQPVVVDGDGGDVTVTPTAGPTETPTITPTATAAGGTIVVSAFTCPDGYTLSAPTANPATDCVVPAGGAAWMATLHLGNQPPMQQPLTGAGTTTFPVQGAGAFSLDIAAPSAPTDAAWTCQGASGQPTTGTGATISAQVSEGEQVTCRVFLVVPSMAGSPTATVTTTTTTTPTVAPGLAAPSGSPAPSLNGPTLNGPGKGSIMLVLDRCPPGFDPASGVDSSNVCQKGYLFTAYPITFTATNTDSDASTTGVNDTFLGWVTFDDLEPGPYRIQAALPTGISTFIFENCGDGATAANGQLSLSATVTAGANVTCYLDAVMDPNLPTPTRAPNTNDSSFSVASALCPAGFVPGTTAVDPTRACTGTGAGIRLNVSGPAGSANPVSAGGTDTLSVSAKPGIYHVSFSLPANIASLAGVSCGGYDIQEQHYIDDRVMTATVSGTDISIDVDVPGAFFFNCTFFVVPTGPSPTPSPSPTLTPTITPTPTLTVARTGQGQTSSGTTSQPASSGAQGAPQGGPASDSGSVAGAPTSTPTPAAAQPAGGLSIVIDSFLCPAGFEEPPAGLAPEGCLDAYPGAVFLLKGLKSGISLQATAGDILPDAAYFTELPPDEYLITQQAAPGIVTSFGYCSLVGGDAQGFPVTPPVSGGTLQHAFDAAARTFTCHWFSIPDASFGGVPNPAPPQGVSLTVHAFTCPAGYDASGADANPTLDCPMPAKGISFTAAGQGAGTSTVLTTGADPANPLDGASRAGTVTFSGLAADTYTLTQGNANGPANAFVSSCSLATAQDPDVPIYPTVSDGSMQYQFNDNESLTCLWYVIPPTDAGTAGATGGQPAQGGGTDDDAAAAAAPPAGAAQGGETDGGAPSTLYLFAYQCPAGYDPAAPGSNPSGDCATPLDGLAVTIGNPAAGGSSGQVTTGEAFSGGAMASGLAAGTYHLTAALAGQTAFAQPCDVSGAEDGSAQPPIELTLSASGEADIAIPADVTVSCTWYVVPASAMRPGGAAVDVAVVPDAVPADRRALPGAA